MIRVALDRAGRVRARTEFDVPLSARWVWGQMRDWRRFLTIDPLHARVRGVRVPPSGGFAGTRFVLEHRLLGVGPDRAARILRWREGRGFDISDLSRRGPRSGFPHVCSYEVVPTGADTSRVVIAARGRWTAAWVPHLAVRLWLVWVLSATRGRVRLYLRAAALHGRG